MTRPFNRFTTVVNVKISSLMDERLSSIASELGVSKADLLRIVIHRIVSKDIEVAVVLKFKTLVDAEKEMLSLRKMRGEDLL